MIDFLIVIAIIWLIFASISDLKKNEVPNWLSFSLIAIALAYKLFYSVVNWNFSYIHYSLLGLGVFIALAYALYYSRVFAGGDAKLLMAFGAVLSSQSSNSSIFNWVLFILLMFSAGGVWGLLYSARIAVKDSRQFKKNFIREFGKRRILFIVFLILTLIFLGLGFYDYILFILAMIFIIFPFLVIYAKSLETLMIVSIPARKATIGDWLAEPITIKNKLIQPDWEGLSESQVKLLANSNKKIKIKQGIPFIPGILIALIIWIFLKDYYYFLAFW